MTINVLAIVLLAALAAGSLAYVLLFSRVQADKKTATRLARVKNAEADTAKKQVARDRVQELSKRRKSVQDTLKEIERKQNEKNKKISSQSLKQRLGQTGLDISLTQFSIASTTLGLVFFCLCFVLGMSLFVSLGIAFTAGAGLPRWIVSFLIRRRQEKFLTEFPNALDVMVRSIKSGLPLNDALRMIAVDAQEPVKTEFRRVVDAQQLGITVPEACGRMFNSMPLQEVSFFAIVIAIQSQAGGNLSEALSNLSKVLRERRKMKAKVSALSMEAKASAVIIGALPFIVAFLVYISSPAYIMVLFTDPRGHMILGFSAFWMSIGIFVMRNMINFDI
ncbi:MULTISPECIES: type II secretion system F family protein [Rhizobium/Agrobacterium group]|uniref:type II secretion system F family protein n=1 Tax=Rhizobium/Agrobacterium group TaxID=227290 RepID=UPI0008DBFDB8|nr:MULTISPECIES: type II secretion system F family protein [Rhizobium/Agrobacterium group]MCF1435725.1 type II secretion system F family protein [Allorhizobium ampelinum]MCF1483129.1 type II secretion system F family protein [Allorhizobium ampelinum]MCF1493299.1 type II secretion system F family protein [Allorhizobium ampelinum]MUO90323.1 pilus assembly protein [Agrobacterium vitis]MUZ52334.1 pilus assembly protein [Agrobacterium vitis]